jgi:hypothetical protein
LDNRGKKAGNQNNGLRQTEAPFILQLDADFVPMPGILIRTIGFFSDPKIAIVQTPQSFLNCEPFRWNLGLEHAMSDDAQAFYFDDQASRDAWGVSFFCGTSAVIRRTALESIGGFPEECDTEDIFTSVILLANGWRTICLPEPLSFGVAPTNLAALIKQRTRWCRGNLQMLFLKRGPLRCPGLSPFQRWAFFSPHWITGNLAQILYAIATASAWFSLSLFPPVQPLDAFFLPVVFFVTICAADWWFQRGVVLPVLKQAYNLFNAFIVLPTALATLVTPRRDVGWKITSSVTNLEKPVCWRLFVPAAALIAAILIGFLVTMTNGFYPDRAPFFALALWCWTTWQLLMLALVARASIERPRHLEEDAIAVDWPAIVHANARTWEASVNMASLSLLSLIIGNDERKELEGQTGLVEIAGIGQFAAFRLMLSVIGYNTNLVKSEEAPKSHADLLDPKWKGKMVKGHPGYSGTIMTATQQLVRDLGWSYFEKLAQQSVMQVQSAADTPKKIALGERAIQVDGNEYNLVLLKEAGQPVEPVYASEGTPIIVGPNGIFKGSPNPNAAKLFQSFL